MFDVTAYPQQFSPIIMFAITRAYRIKTGFKDLTDRFESFEMLIETLIWNGLERYQFANLQDVKHIECEEV